MWQSINWVVIWLAPWRLPRISRINIEHMNYIQHDVFDSQTSTINQSYQIALSCLKVFLLRPRPQRWQQLLQLTTESCLLCLVSLRTPACVGPLRPRNGRPTHRWVRGNRHRHRLRWGNQGMMQLWSGWDHLMIYHLHWLMPLIWLDHLRCLCTLWMCLVPSSGGTNHRRRRRRCHAWKAWSHRIWCWRNAAARQP